jgi:hypothetical protein
MKTFVEWLTHLDLLSRLTLIETYYSFDPVEYNRLFQQELKTLLLRVNDPAHRAALESMRDFDWVAYIASSIRRSGFRDQREVQERTHDLVSKLLVGTLFRGFDERKSGPMPLRFRMAVTNAIKNVRSKEANRRRYLPSVSIAQEYQPGGVTDDELMSRLAWRGEDRDVIEGFRRLVKARRGELALAVLDTRVAGPETQSLIGREELGRPDKNQIKKTVQQIKSLAREYAEATGDQGFMRAVDRTMGREYATVQKRLLTTRQGRVGIEL